MADKRRTRSTDALTPQPARRVAAPALPVPAPRAVKDDEIRVRVSSEHKAAMIAAAQREGLELSAWLRQLALRAAGILPSK